MILYLNGEDIAHLTIALVARDTAGNVSFAGPLEKHPVRVEGYLKDITDYLKAQNVALKDLTGIALFSGQGSATALRSVYALAHAWSFALEIPIFSIPPVSGKTESDALLESDFAPVAFLEPTYAQTPHITATNKDALRHS